MPFLEYRISKKTEQTISSVEELFFFFFQANIFLKG